MAKAPVEQPFQVEIFEKDRLVKSYVEVDKVTYSAERFDGTMSEALTREVIHRGHASAVLPYDPVLDVVVLLEQFRLPIHLAGENGWDIEIVAGIVEEGETSEEVARREAFEEAGLTVFELERIGRVFLSPGILTETAEIFCGRVDARNAGGTFGLEEEGEDIRAFVVPAETYIQQAKDGYFSNATALIAAQWFALNHEKLRALWTDSEA